MSARTVIRKVAPPIVLDGMRWLRGIVSDESNAPVWEHIPEGWSAQEHDSRITGWNVPAIRDWHRDRFATWSQAFRPPKPFGASEYANDSTELHLHSHNVHVSFAYVLALASAHRSSLSILDWGGGIGQHYLLARDALAGIELSYHCKDLPLVCEVGEELMPDIVFCSDESCFDRRYDVVVASNSLQYSPDWRQVLGRLAEAALEYLYIAQLPCVGRTDSFVAVQRPYAYGYGTEYLGWVFNRLDFVDALAVLDVELVREFFFDHEISVTGIDEPAVHRGFLLRRLPGGTGRAD